MKTTILGGMLFLVPVVVVIVILGKAFQISMMVAHPIDAVIPIESISGVALVNILAILLIVLLCYLAGLVAKRGVGRARMDQLEGLLIDIVPAYVRIKGMLGSVARKHDVESLMKPVMVAFDDYDQIAFELESDGVRSVLFLPGSPSAWSGSTVIVDSSRVTPMDVPMHEAAKVMRVLGRGSMEMHSALAGASKASSATGS